MQQIQKKISEFLTNKPVSSVPVDATVLNAIEIMSSQRSDCVIVLEDRAIVGIFSERDFLNRVAAVNLNPAETYIQDVMTSHPEVLKQSECISYAIERMANRGFRNIPVIKQGVPSSVLSVWDVMSHLTDVLEEVEENGNDDEFLDEWTDIGGGG